MRTPFCLFTLIAGVAALLAAPQNNDIAAGETIFFGKGNCSSCHEVNGRGGIVGPDLSAAGTRTPEALRAKILNPNNSSGGRGGAPQVIVAKRSDVREIQGVRRNEDTFNLQIVDASGQLHVLDKTTLREVQRENRSLMPQDYAKRLSDTELRYLVAYLSSLKARDLAVTALTNIPGGVTYERLRNAKAEPHNWLHYWGDYQGTHYSGLKEITVANVSRLQAKWAATLSTTGTLETQPLVVDGSMYATAPGTVVALDAKTGRQIWTYTRQQKVRNPNEINPFNRGVAVLGNRVFFGTLDAALVAIDARTGRQLWETQVADTMLGPRPNDPPPSSGIKAIDPETGKTVWDFKTNQGSLSNGVLATAGGVLFAATREGTLVALDAKTGKYLWRFQGGVGMAASPMSYAIDGKQFVAVAAGGAVYSFALPTP